MKEQNPMHDYFIFDKRIREKYTELNTKHLNEHDLIAKAIEILRDKLVINPFDYSEFKLLSEIDYLTQEIKYQSAMLHILKTGINNPNSEHNTYNQKVEDHRYLMYSNWAFQTIYNYWDRLGDLLWHFYDTNLKAEDVYFIRIINLIAKEYQSRNYINLIKHYDEMVKPLMEDRKKIVHYYSLETLHRWNHIEHRSLKDNDEMYFKKANYAKIVTEQLEVCIKGFELTLDIINELPSKKRNNEKL